MVDRWNYCLLSSVCEEITSGGAAPQGDKYFINGKYPFVRVVDMGNLHGQKYMLQTRDLLNDVGAEKLRLFPSGTILFTKSGASLLLNQRAILKVPMYVVSHIGCLIPNEAVISEWLYYWMKTVDFNIYAHATTLPSLKLTTIKELRIPVPTIPEQERIVAWIEELFSQLDAGVETLKKTKAQLAVYRQAVLKEAFSCCAEKKPIREMSSVVTSGSRGWAKYYCDNGAKFIRIGNLTRNKIYIDLDDIQHVQLPDKAEGTRTKLAPNDVLVSITADLGNIGLVPNGIGEAYVNQHIAMIRFNNQMQGEFYAWYLRSEYGQQDLLRNKRGGGKLGLGLDDIRDSRVPVVSNETAESILSIIECRLSVCDSIEQTVDTALQQAEVMRQSILKQAFKGEL